MPPTGVLITRSDFPIHAEQPPISITRSKKINKKAKENSRLKEVLVAANASTSEMPTKKKLTYRQLFEKRRPSTSENIRSSDEDEEMLEEADKSPPVAKNAKNTTKSGKMNSVAKPARKGEYYVKNADGVPAEKFSMVYRHKLHNGEDLDDDGDEHAVPGTSGQVSLTDNWKPDYNNGVQELVDPHHLPKLQLCDFGENFAKKVPFKAPKKLITISKPEKASNSSRYVSQETHSFLNLPNLRIYNGDGQDVVFVEKLNQLRINRHGKTYISMKRFLDVMDALEIECFKNIHETLLKPLHSPAINDLCLNDDEAVCDICRLAECEADDEMVFCDGCNICVHMSCYGINELPEGDWMCMKCSLGHFNTAFPCALCPTMNGAMKCTKSLNRWVHISCALWIPECHFGDTEKREVIKNIENIPAERWQLKCSVCDTRQGACIQCVVKGCNTPFHATCAIKSGFVMKIEDPDDPNADDVKFSCYCKKHSNKDGGDSQKSASSSNASQESNEQLKKLEQTFYFYADYEKIARRLRIPLILVSDVYEYWKQKRGANNGRPLIADPQDKISLDRGTINLCLPSTSQARLPTFARPQIIPPTPMSMRRQNLKNARCSIDKGINMMTLLVKREKLKKQQLESVKESVMRLFKLTEKSTSSGRAAENAVEMLDSIFTKEDNRLGKNVENEEPYVKFVLDELDGKQPSYRHVIEQVKKEERTPSPKKKDGDSGTPSRKRKNVESASITSKRRKVSFSEQSPVKKESVKRRSTRLN